MFIFAGKSTVNKRCYRRFSESNAVEEAPRSSLAPEVQSWLVTTFTKQVSDNSSSEDEDKLNFRTVANAIRSGNMVRKIFSRVPLNYFSEKISPALSHAYSVSC